MIPRDRNIIFTSTIQRSICRGVGGFNPHWLKMTPHWWLKIFVWGVGFDPPPVPIQQDIQMISKYGTFHSNFEDRKAYYIWLQEMKPLDD